MNVSIDVLDHGKVCLLESMGDDYTISRAARVVRPDNEDPRAMGADEKLLTYMLDNGHTSPFEHVTFNWYVKLPIFVTRQWHRHRTWSYNEISGRYRELDPEFYIPKPETIGAQSAKNHQSRDITKISDRDLEVRRTQCLMVESYCRQQFYRYQDLIASGWPRELARILLPLNTYTEMTATVNLHNLLKFLEQRMDGHAQWEIRQYARVLYSLIYKVVPLTCDIWRDLHPGLEYPND